VARCGPPGQDRILQARARGAASGCVDDGSKALDDLMNRNATGKVVIINSDPAELQPARA